MNSSVDLFLLPYSERETTPLNEWDLSEFERWARKRGLYNEDDDRGPEPSSTHGGHGFRWWTRGSSKRQLPRRPENMIVIAGDHHFPVHGLEWHCIHVHAGEWVVHYCGIFGVLHLWHLNGLIDQAIGLGVCLNEQGFTIEGAPRSHVALANIRKGLTPDGQRPLRYLTRRSDERSSS